MESLLFKIKYNDINIKETKKNIAIKSRDSVPDELKWSEYDS